MVEDTIGNWVNKAKASDANEDSSSDSRIKVIRREVTSSRGGMIMEIAEKLRPILLKFFNGVRDENGALYQPAHIRGYALNMAQDMLKEYEQNLLKKQA